MGKCNEMKRIINNFQQPKSQIQILKSDISHIIQKDDVQLLYLKSGKYWVCTKQPFIENGIFINITLAIKVE